MAEEQQMDYLVEKKVEYLVDMKLGKIKNDLQSALQKVDEMASEIELLKKKVQRLNLGIPSEGEAQSKLVYGSGNKEEAKKESGNSNSFGSRGRTGDYTPGDKEVSVENMFYYGNKR